MQTGIYDHESDREYLKDIGGRRGNGGAARPRQRRATLSPASASGLLFLLAHLVAILGWDIRAIVVVIYGRWRR